MLTPISAPWCLRFNDATIEVRVLLRVAGVPLPSKGWTQPPEMRWPGIRPPGIADAPCLLRWTPAEGVATRDIGPRLRATPLGDDIAVGSFTIENYAGRGGTYVIECEGWRSARFALVADPKPGQSWRFLIASDHQIRPGALLSIWAASRLALRRPFNAILFPGDMAQFPDDPAGWAGNPQGLSFIDSMSARAELVWVSDTVAARPARSPGLPLLSTTPIIACPGNHEVSSNIAGNIAGNIAATAAERFSGVQPDSWNIDTFAAMFLPWQDGGEPGWYAATVGPLRIAALFISRYWVPGDHLARTGPCYEPPGRFIFAPFTPGSPQYAWLNDWAAASDRARLGVVLLHDAPFAQGHNALPLFGEPVEYRTHLVVEHLAPLFEKSAVLVLAGHNHAVNHHVVRGVHYFESSQFAFPLSPARWLPDGRVAPEPLGHPSRCFFAEEGRTFFSIMEVTPGSERAAGQVVTYRVFPNRLFEEAYRFDL